MRKGIVSASLVLAFGTAGAGSEEQNGDEPLSRQEFYSAARAAGVFEQVDENRDGVVDKQEFRDARLPQNWQQWAESEEELDPDEFYERAFEAYDEAARAVRAFPAP